MRAQPSLCLVEALADVLVDALEVVGAELRRDLPVVLQRGRVQAHPRPGAQGEETTGDGMVPNRPRCEEDDEENHGAPGRDGAAQDRVSPPEQRDHRHQHIADQRARTHHCEPEYRHRCDGTPAHVLTSLLACLCAEHRPNRDAEQERGQHLGEVQGGEQHQGDVTRRDHCGRSSGTASEALCGDEGYHVGRHPDQS